MIEMEQMSEAGSAYARLADDCDRWGLAAEAAELRLRSRETVVEEIRETAGASAAPRTPRFRLRMA